MGMVGGMPPSTYSYSPILPPEDNFPVSLKNWTWHLCSRRAFREHCQSHSDRGHGSGGLPSVPWPLDVAWLVWLLPGRICLWPLHVAICEDEGVVAHVSRREVFSGQFSDPVMELVVTLCDEAALIASMRMAY